MHPAGSEPVRGLEVGDQSGELVEWDVLSVPAVLTHEMLVCGVFAQMKHGRSMTQVHMMNTPDRLECLDGAIHGRGRDPVIGELFGHLVELGSGQVLVVMRRHHLTDRSPGGGDPKARTSELVYQLRRLDSRHDSATGQLVGSFDHPFEHLAGSTRVDRLVRHVDRLDEPSGQTRGNDRRCRVDD